MSGDDVYELSIDDPGNGRSQESSPVRLPEAQAIAASGGAPRFLDAATAPCPFARTGSSQTRRHRDELADDGTAASALVQSSRLVWFRPDADGSRTGLRRSGAVPCDTGRKYGVRGYHHPLG